MSTFFLAATKKQRFFRLKKQRLLTRQTLCEPAAKFFWAEMFMGFCGPYF